MQHHDAAIERYVERIGGNPDVLAVVVTGSVARGTERATSDIDLYLVVTEEAFARGLAENRVIYVEYEGAGYEGGYYDIKLASLDYLDEAAERGDDAVRDSFAHATIPFSRVDDLAARLDRVAVPPEAEWLPKAESFLAQARLHGEYFLDGAFETGDIVLLHHAGVHLVVAASRALLALDHRLYQGPKYLAKTMAALDARPADWPTLVDSVVRDPSPTTAGALLAALESFHDWRPTFDDSLSTFVLDNELAWRYRTKTPEYS